MQGSGAEVKLNVFNSLANQIPQATENEEKAAASG